MRSPRRREIDLGFAQIGAYLSAAGRADTTAQPSDEEIHGTHHEGRNG